MASLIQQISYRGDNETIFVVCGYGQSRSIPYYIYLSPKVKEGRIEEVCRYRERYETILSKDTAEQ